MSKKEIAGQYFKDGCNCCQAVLMAFKDEIGIDEKTLLMLGSSFGGGIARLREVCGAVSGLEMVLGFKEGYSDIKDHKVKTDHYKKAQDLAEEFRKINGDIVCRNLLGLSEEKSVPVPEERTTGYYKKRPCKELVECAAEILDNYFQNKKDKA